MTAFIRYLLGHHWPQIPPTTEYDRLAVKKLLKLSKVKNLRAYSNELLEAGNI